MERDGLLFRALILRFVFILSFYFSDFHFDIEPNFKVFIRFIVDKKETKLRYAHIKIPPFSQTICLSFGRK